MPRKVIRFPGLSRIAEAIRAGYVWGGLLYWARISTVGGGDVFELGNETPFETDGILRAPAG